MSEDRLTTEIDKVIAATRLKANTANQAADKAEVKRLKQLAADTPDLDGATRSAVERDRALMGAEAYARRLPALEAERKEAAEREAAEATAAAKKALEDRIAVAEKAMIVTFGDDALDRQIEVLEGAAAVVDEVNAERARIREGGDGLSVEVPIAVRAALTIQLYDPETCGICWNYKGRDMRQKGDRKAA